MAVQTETEKQQSTKLEDIGKRAKCIPETKFNNIAHVVDMHLLRECYRQLEWKKAVGIDGVSKKQYGERLEANLEMLLARLKGNGYNPQASKPVEIEKEDGSARSLAISCFEDKVVQLAVSKILTAIFEPEFLPCSYGYRAGTNAHEALRALMKHSNSCPEGATIEIDLRKYFNSIPHEILMEMLKKKITDKKFLRLVMKLIRAPLMVNGKAELNKVGSPQGSIVSPILANIYLHYVIDGWFYTIRKSHLKGKAELVRFADDMVFVFENREEAERFYQVLPKRLGKYGLKIHEDKSSILETGSLTAQKAEVLGERVPTYKFLGFVCYWGKSRSGRWRLKYKSRGDRLTEKLKDLRCYLKGKLSQETEATIKQVKRVIVGWINYHGISDNQRSVQRFIYLSKRTLHWWINRKGGKRKMNWGKFGALIKRMNYPETYRTTSMFTTC